MQARNLIFSSYKSFSPIIVTFRLKKPPGFRHLGLLW